ncbi:DUF1858 domain-containing protein [Caldilinea sp.]|uniref:DUF1858 domain-containing protein n=1 Tax=Caldilinea sp. TaxID=2293560 RepID=UPI0021DE5270|nr:DUF1858 domain-containing protein [Caldilinea sp.]GIV68354.1 MAG: hypothetical protein KatS3mg048_1216 [Caldilinea sp.]
MESAALSQLPVAEVMERWPQTIPVFVRRRMACVGCVMAPFETLAEVATIYNLNLPDLLAELRQRIPDKGNKCLQDQEEE